MVIQKKQTILSRVLTALFSRLEVENQPYCVCGNYKDLPFYTENDVDIWAKYPIAVVNIIKEVCNENGLDLYLENKNATGSNLFFWTFSGKEPVTIHIDVLCGCRWLSFLPLVNSKLIEQNRKKFNGFFIANDTIDAAMHFMHPLTHFGVIRDKYKKSLEIESREKSFWKIIEPGFGTEFCQEIQPHFKERNWGAIEDAFSDKKRKLLVHMIRRMRWVEYCSFYKFINSNIKRLFRPTGLSIAFIGPDACGKTTVQKNLQPFFEKAFTKGKIKSFYWRPFLFPRIQSLFLFGREKHSKESNPTDRLKLRRSGLFRRFFHSIKLLYYCLDFFVGRFKYQGVWSKGGVVCFDRYWYDLLVFPERFALNVPRTLVKLLSIFVPKLDIIFYLHAEAEVLLERKYELPIEEVRRQIYEYKILAEGYTHFSTISSDLSEADVLSEVISSCLAKMSTRYK